MNKKGFTKMSVSSAIVMSFPLVGPESIRDEKSEGLRTSRNDRK